MEHRSFAPDIVVPNDDYACGNKRAGELAPDVAPEELRKEKQVGGPVNCSDSELCTFLQALAEGYLPTFYSDTSQSAQSKSMSIASKSFRRGKKTVVFHGFPSLKMSRHSTEDLGAELLMWWQEDFHAKTSALPEAGPDWTAKGQGYGEKWLGLLGKYDPVSCSLKTAQLSLLEDSTGCCPTLPRWGLMLDGELYQQPIPALCTKESAYGFLRIPTPTVYDSTGKGSMRKDNNAEEGGMHGVSLHHFVKMFPTPTATDAGSGRFNTSVGSDKPRPTLAMMAKRNQWPTPTASASKGSSQASLVRKDGKDRSSDRLDHAVMALENGRLNPEFCEWLMGWPIGQTELRPLGMDKYQEWRQQHSPCFTETKEAA